MTGHALSTWLMATAWAHDDPQPESRASVEVEVHCGACSCGQWVGSTRRGRAALYEAWTEHVAEVGRDVSRAPERLGPDALPAQSHLAPWRPKG